MRRVVTSVDSEGRSFVQSDEEIPDHGAIWTVQSTDAPWAEAIADLDVLQRVQPKPGSVFWAMGQYGPNTTHGGYPEGERPPQGFDENGFHVTKTIDLIMVVDGTLTLGLDLDEVVLQPGDLVVLQAGRHVWRNTTDRPARFLDVLIATDR